MVSIAQLGPRFAGSFKFLGSFGSLAVAAGLQFLTLVIVARILGPQDFGIFASLLAASAVAAEFVGLSAGDLFVRDVTRGASPDQSSGAAIILIVATGAVVLPIISSINFYVAKPYVPVLYVIGFSFTETVLFRLWAFSEQAGLAMHNTKIANLVRITPSTIRVVIFLLATLTGHLNSISAAVGLQILSSSVSALIIAILTFALVGQPKFGLHKRHIADGALMSAWNIARVAQQNADRVIVSLLVGREVAGFYNATMRVVVASLLPAQSMLRVYYRSFFIKQNHSDRLRMTLRYIRNMVAMGIISAIFILICAKYIDFIFGHQFSGARNMLAMCAFLPLIWSLEYLGFDFLSGSNRLRLRAVLALSCVLTLLGLLYLMLRVSPSNLMIIVVSLNMGVTIIVWLVAAFFPGNLEVENQRE